MMLRLRVVGLAFAVAVLSVDAAQAQQADYDAPPTETLYPLPKVDDAVPWELLLDVELVYEGIDLVPEYNEEAQALAGERVKLVGFLLPLAADQKRGLLSMISPDCPFCLPGGPQTFVELIAPEPLEWTSDAVVVTGRFELLEDSLSGYFYRMTEVELVDDPSMS